MPGLKPFFGLRAQFAKNRPADAGDVIFQMFFYNNLHLLDFYYYLNLET
jgi:hypothetical protein